MKGEALRVLEQLAAAKGVSLEDMLARAIATQRAVAEARARGDKVVIEHRDDTRELVLA